MLILFYIFACVKLFRRCLFLFFLSFFKDKSEQHEEGAKKKSLRDSLPDHEAELSNLSVEKNVMKTKIKMENFLFHDMTLFSFFSFFAFKK